MSARHLLFCAIAVVCLANVGCVNCRQCTRCGDCPTYDTCCSSCGMPDCGCGMPEPECCCPCDEPVCGCPTECCDEVYCGSAVRPRRCALLAGLCDALCGQLPCGCSQGACNCGPSYAYEMADGNPLVGQYGNRSRIADNHANLMEELQTANAGGERSFR